MNNGFFQKKKIAIQKIKNKINFFESKKAYLEDAQCLYYPTFTDSIGLFNIYKFSETKINRLSFFIKILKNIFSGIYFSNSKIIQNLNKNSFSNIIITWANLSNFKYDGSLDDRFFNMNSRKSKNTLWIVIYSDKDLPKKINKNILIYKNVKTKINFTKFIIFLITKIFNYKNFILFVHSISNFSFFGGNFFNDIKIYLKPEVKNIFFPFEYQPFQNKIIHYVKEKKFKTKIIGYIHAPPLSFPSNYIYRKISPDELILNGEDQLHCFTKHLNWPKKIIKVRPSTRFLNDNSISMKNKIYFPMTIRDELKVIDSFKKIIDSSRYDITNMKIQKHPFSAKEQKVVNFENKLKNILKSEKKKKKQNTKNLSIFIGSTGAIVEALERGVNVIQICEFPVLDVYSSIFWKNIIVKQIHNNVFTYRLKKKGKLIKLGKLEKNKKLYGYKL